MKFRKGLGIGPRIIFTCKIVRDKCIQADIQKTHKKQSYDFCKKVIYTPQQYRDQRYIKKKYKKYCLINIVIREKSLRRVRHIGKLKRVIIC